ncbi:MAG: CotH kinase family protein [Muribaculaceae bacterium]|nr:CotH kinase family protein [Muribaculaceae bacterium]
MTKFFFRYIFLALTLVLCQGISAAQTAPVALNDIIGKGLPVVEVCTENEQEPTCDIIYAPEGLTGTSITNAIKVPGRLKIYDNEGAVAYDTGDYVKSESGMTIKVRGNTSAITKPKPFKIKLQKKGDLLRRGDKKYNDKNWVLLKDYALTTFVGFTVNEAFKLYWTPQGEYVSLMINGTYRGIYLLAEAVERNADCRINVDKSGFIAELDPYWWNEDGEYLTSLSWNPWLNYTLKYPDFEDATEDQLNYIQSALDEYEQSIIDDTYDQVIDCESFARALLAQDCLGIQDWSGSNIYFSKYDDSADSKMHRPVLWDFDTSECTPDAWSNPHIHYFNQFLDSPNTAFKAAYIDLWNREGRQAIDQVIEKIEAFRNSDRIEAVNRAAELTKQHLGLSMWKPQDCLDRSIAWYKSRKAWMENAIGNMEEEFKASVSEIGDSETPPVVIEGNTIRSANGEPFSVYTLQAIPLSTDGASEVTVPGSGVYIIVSTNKSLKINIQ